MKQRNAQLWRVREGAATDSLDAWDRQLARVALAFEERRRAIVTRLSASYQSFAAALAPGGGEFSVSLVSQLDELSAAAPSSSAASGSLAAPPGPPRACRRRPPAVRPKRPSPRRLRTRRGGEIGRAVSGFGPHRDDLRFAEEGLPLPDGGAARDLRLFGSQGEQRAAVLALLLAERAVAAELTGDLGALLLDDVMSELDDARRRLLVGALTAGGQAIITTTNRLYFTAGELASAKVIELAGGAAEPDA